MIKQMLACAVSLYASAYLGATSLYAQQDQTSTNSVDSVVTDPTPKKERRTMINQLRNPKDLESYVGAARLLNTDLYDALKGKKHVGYQDADHGPFFTQVHLYKSSSNPTNYTVVLATQRKKNQPDAKDHTTLTVSRGLGNNIDVKEYDQQFSNSSYDYSQFSIGARKGEEVYVFLEREGMECELIVIQFKENEVKWGKGKGKISDPKDNQKKQKKKLNQKVRHILFLSSLCKMKKLLPLAMSAITSLYVGCASPKPPHSLCDGSMPTYTQRAYEPDTKYTSQIFPPTPRQTMVSTINNSPNLDTYFTTMLRTDSELTNILNSHLQIGEHQFRHGRFLSKLKVYESLETPEKYTFVMVSQDLKYDHNDRSAQVSFAVGHDFEQDPHATINQRFGLAFDYGFAQSLGPEQIITYFLFKGDTHYRAIILVKKEEGPQLFDEKGAPIEEIEKKENQASLSGSVST